MAKHSQYLKVKIYRDIKMFWPVFRTLTLLRLGIERGR